MGTAQIASAPSTGGKIFYKMLHLLLLLSASSLVKASYGPALGLRPDIGPRYGYSSGYQQQHTCHTVYDSATDTACHTEHDQACNTEPATLSLGRSVSQLPMRSASLCLAKCASLWRSGCLVRCATMLRSSTTTMEPELLVVEQELVFLALELEQDMDM